MAYDVVIQITATPAMREALREIARQRHPYWSRKQDREMPNVAAAGREAIAEYIAKYKEVK